MPETNMPKPIVVTLDKERNMYLTMGAIMEYEEMTGKSIDSMKEGQIKEAVTFIYCMLQYDNEELTLKEVGHMIHPGNMHHVFEKIAEAQRAMKTEKPETEKEKAAAKIKDTQAKNKKRSAG